MKSHYLLSVLSAGALIIFHFSVFPHAAAAQARAPQTVLTGAYTTAQAKRGQEAYQVNCAGCHREDLSGFSGPPLKGAVFMDRWREFKLDVLLKEITTTMPRDAPKTLSESVYLDIVAYLLQGNDLPPGNIELTTDLAEQLLLVGKDGPMPLPSSSPVDAVGCLTDLSGGGWFLTHASEPVRTLDPWVLSPAEIQAVKARPLADLQFRLQDISDVMGFNPGNASGSKIEVKGILVRQPGNERINVTNAQVLEVYALNPGNGAACDK